MGSSHTIWIRVGRETTVIQHRRLAGLTRLSVFRFRLFVGQNFGSYGGGRLTDCAWEGNKWSFPGSDRGSCKASRRNRRSSLESRGLLVGALPDHAKDPRNDTFSIISQFQCGLLENFMIIFATEAFHQKTRNSVARIRVPKAMSRKKEAINCIRTWNCMFRSGETNQPRAALSLRFARLRSWQMEEKFPQALRNNRKNIFLNENDVVAELWELFTVS